MAVDPVTGTAAAAKVGLPILRGLLGLRKPDVDPFKVSAENPVTPTTSQVEQAKREFRGLQAARGITSSSPASVDPSPVEQPGVTPAPEPTPEPPASAGGEPPAFGGIFPAGLMGPIGVAEAAAEIASIGRIIVGAAVRGGIIGLGSIFPDEVDEESARLGTPGDVVIMKIPPPGSEGPSQAQFETQDVPKVDVQPPPVIEEITPVLRRRADFKLEEVPLPKPAAVTSPAPAPRTFRIPPIVTQGAVAAAIVAALGRGGKTRELTFPQGPQIDLTPPGSVVEPPRVQIPSPVASTTGVVVPSLSPNLARQASRDRTRDKECRIVKRRRRRKKCREGYFIEEQGRTTYKTWRVKDCLTGKTILET